MITKISKELLIQRISIAPRECQLQVCYYSAFNSSSKWRFHSNCGNGSGFLCTALQRLWTRSGSRHIWKQHTCPVCQMDGSAAAGTAPARRVCPPGPPFAVSRFAAPDGSSARQSKTQTLKIPLLVFMALRAMKLNHFAAQQGLWDSMVISLSLFIMVCQLRGNASRVWFLSSPIHEEKL